MSRGHLCSCSILYRPCGEATDALGMRLDLRAPNISLTKLMISHDLPRSTVNNQIAFDQRDLYFTPEIERMMDHGCQMLVSKLETLDTTTFI